MSWWNLLRTAAQPSRAAEFATCPKLSLVQLKIIKEQKRWRKQAAQLNEGNYEWCGSLNEMQLPCMGLIWLEAIL